MREFKWFLLSLILIITDGFYLLPAHRLSLQCANVAIYAICIMELFNSREFFNVKNDKVGKIILFITAYYFVSYIFTCSFGIQSIKDATIVLITDSFPLAYFVFRKIPSSTIKQLSSIIIIVSFIGGVLYYLQFVGIHLLNGVVNDDFNGVKGLERMRNTPHFLYAILFYLFYSNKDFPYKTALILFFLPMVILPMTRGLVIAFIIANIIYQFAFLKNKTKILKYIIPGLFVYMAFSSFIESRFLGKTGRVNFFTEVKNGLNILKTGSNMFVVDDTDTFVFRMTIFAERINYWINNPSSFIHGDGCLHETEALVKKYHFNYGQLSSNISEKWYPRQVLNTDVSFITGIMRYGIPYLVFIFFFVFYSFKRLFKMKNNIYSTIGINVFLMALFRCLASVPFFDLQVSRMFLLLLIPAIIYNIERKNNATKLIRDHSNI